MILIDDVNEKIENIFSRLGIPTRVVFLDSASTSPVEIVFPMRREVDLQQAAYTARHDLDQVGCSPDRLIPRTILFHLAYEVFGVIPTPPNGFISTNITNLDKPIIKKKRISDRPPFSTRSHPASGALWEALVFNYNIDVIIGTPQIQFAEPMAIEASAAAKRFNQSSRLLKIGQLRYAWSNTRHVKPLDFRPITLTHDT
ncbi:hypothetical protein [Corallococcus sp. AB045]|uniref:hypothetical protein n=1 Tax=Corallococcus sp. AB045 TaxID=2316719 RepID=UPI0011C44D57|nr:hypothetical protein [Corallococcus sp. AB045]